MKLAAEYAVECCDRRRVFHQKYEAIEWLLNHIMRMHSGLYKAIAKEGRALARSQNGCEYYDGSDKDTGWRRAQSTFRRAWIENALKARLERKP